MLKTETAKKLYHEHAAKLPVIDYHCHINPMEIYEKCNAILAQPDMSVRGIIRKSNVKLLCTTDDPVDDLKAHELPAADPTVPAVVLPGGSTTTRWVWRSR